MDTTTEIKTLQHFIGGEWVDAATGETFEDLNPLDDSLYAVAAKGSGDDIRQAIAAAKSAFPAYKETTPTERERWLLRVAEIMESRQSDLVDCLIDEVGSTVGKAMFELNKGLAMVRAAAGMCRNVRGETIPSDVPGMFSMSIREPLGVVCDHHAVQRAAHQEYPTGRQCPRPSETRSCTCRPNWRLICRS